MKHVRRFIILVAILGVGSLLMMIRPHTTIEGQASDALNRHYNAIKAKDINSKELFIVCDGKTENMQGDIWMSEDLDLMIPLLKINDLLKCQVSRIEQNIIQISEADHIVTIDLNENRYFDGVQWNAQTIFAVKNGEDYIAVSSLAAIFEYDYKWDSESNTAYLKTGKKETLILPSEYDARTKGHLSEVKNQGNTDACWAYATISALEFSSDDFELPKLSVDDLVENHGFATENLEGGDYNMSLAYLTSWRGPVLDTDEKMIAAHLQDAVIPREKDYEQIKELIYQYGAVQSAVYLQADVRDYQEFYNEDKFSYYYPEEKVCNHDVVIVGWDDSFPKENFMNQPEIDGAFLCQNSWGNDFGDDGYFYISYADKNIGTHSICYTSIESVDNYDQIYQTDILGWTGSIGYNEPDAWMANVYTADKNSEMAAVGIYATDDATQYDLYIVHDFESVEDFERMEFLESGILTSKGYNTIDIHQKPYIAQNEKIAVVVNIYTENSVHPIAIEYVSGERTGNADISDGEGYISYNGSLWSRAETAADCNICLKVYMNDKGE